MKYGFGIDLGGTTVKIAYFDETGKMLDKWEIPTVTANGGAQILPDIAASIRQYIEGYSIPETAILGLGIGVPGPVNAKGVVNKCINLGWGVFNIAEELSALTGFPVKAGNDANVAALGEIWMGTAKGCRSMVMVTLGTGVGGGVIVNGNVLCGAHGAGGEIGHITVNPHEKAACGCGKHGCLEQYSSATGIVRCMKLLLETSSEPCVLRGREFAAKDVLDAARDGDKLALREVNNMADTLGFALAGISSTVDPEMFLLGGGVSRAGDILVDAVTAAFKKYAFSACVDTPIKIATTAITTASIKIPVTTITTTITTIKISITTIITTTIIHQGCQAPIIRDPPHSTRWAWRGSKGWIQKYFKQ